MSDTSCGMLEVLDLHGSNEMQVLAPAETDKGIDQPSGHEKTVRASMAVKISNECLDTERLSVHQRLSVYQRLSRYQISVLIPNDCQGIK